MNHKYVSQHRNTSTNFNMQSRRKNWLPQQSLQYVIWLWTTPIVKCQYMAITLKG